MGHLRVITGKVKVKGAKWKSRYLRCFSELILVNGRRAGSKVNQGMPHPDYYNLITFCETKGAYDRSSALGRIHHALTLPQCLVVSKRATRTLVQWWMCGCYGWCSCTLYNQRPISSLKNNSNDTSLQLPFPWRPCLYSTYGSAIHLGYINK